MEDAANMPDLTGDQRSAAHAIATFARELNNAIDRGVDADLRVEVTTMPVSVQGKRYDRPIIRVTVSAPVEMS